MRKISKVLTTSRIAMTSKGLVLILLVTIVLATGCSTVPVEGPICVPPRSVLSDISIEDQQWLHLHNQDLLLQIGSNDAALKSQVRLLERLIQNHDEPLGSCE